MEDLHVSFGKTEVLRGVSFKVSAGKTLGIVGESGCGKSLTALALMGMLPPTAQVTTGKIFLENRDLCDIPKRDWLAIRGQEIAMVMQDPFTSLNPMMKVGDQIAEVYRLHQGLSKSESKKRAVEVLAQVGVPSPENSAKKYPHQMSGGQRQRVVIGCAFATNPKVLIADEPTTALDVTLQAQILHLIKELQAKNNTAVILISHDIGVIGSISDQVAVFYAGQIVEYGSAHQVLKEPQHPYAEALLRAIPTIGLERLEQIPGQPPLFTQMPSGCAFQPRCQKAFEACGGQPKLKDIGDGHEVACWALNPVQITQEV